MGTRAEGAAWRQRRSLTLTALLPTALGLLGPLCSAGRLSWLGPVLALPVGLWLCLLWRELGREGLPRALEGVFGRWFGRVAQLGYLLWALILLLGSAQKYAHRLGRLLPGTEWFFLLSALTVCLWLSRGREEIFARTGRLFFLASAVTLVFALALAVPGLNWRNLWPPEGDDLAGVLYSALLSLSLAGYGVFALCLPCQEEERRHFGGAVWGCAALAWLLLTVVGTFGPRLAGSLDEPFLMALQGVEVPGAFRRGEAALAAVLTLADFALLALLSRSSRSLWERMTPKSWAWGGYVLPALAILAAGMLGKDGGWGGDWLPVGNLILGVVVPALAVLGQKARRSKKGQPIFSAPKMAEKADVGKKTDSKKSLKENQKKC